MNTNTRTRRSRLVAVVGLLAVTLLAGNAQAAGDVDPHGFNDVKQMIAKMPEMTDANKDGMITRKEYLDMQGRLFDMASKKKGAMTMEKFNSFMNEFRVFGQ